MNFAEKIAIAKEAREAGAILRELPRVRFPKARCSVCKRIRHLTSSGVFVQHGPGPDSYVCSGSGRAS